MRVNAATLLHYLKQNGIQGAKSKARKEELVRLAVSNFGSGNDKISIKNLSSFYFLMQKLVYETDNIIIQGLSAELNQPPLHVVKNLSAVNLSPDSAISAENEE